VGETAGQSLESGLALGRILLDPGSSKTPPDERSLDLGRDVRRWPGFLQCALAVSQSVTLHASGSEDPPLNSNSTELGTTSGYPNGGRIDPSLVVRQARH
jgi:hypothetical protein